MGDAGVGDQHLDWSLLGLDLGEGLVHRGGVPDVAGHGGQAGHGIARPRRHGDLIAAGRQAAGDGQPDAPVPAGDEDGSAHRRAFFHDHLIDSCAPASVPGCRHGAWDRLPLGEHSTHPGPPAAPAWRGITHRTRHRTRHAAKHRTRHADRRREPGERPSHRSGVRRPAPARAGRRGPAARPGARRGARRFPRRANPGPGDRAVRRPPRDAGGRGRAGPGRPGGAERDLGLRRRGGPDHPGGGAGRGRGHRRGQGRRRDEHRAHRAGPRARATGRSAGSPPTTRTRSTSASATSWPCCPTGAGG